MDSQAAFCLILIIRAASILPWKSVDVSGGACTKSCFCARSQICPTSCLSCLASCLTIYSFLEQIIFVKFVTKFLT